MSRSKNTRLQLYAFDTDLSKWENEMIYQLEMPSVWKAFILQFQRDEIKRDKGLAIKVKPLGIKLQSIFPHIVWINHQFYLDSAKPWIIATKPIPVDLIIAIAQGWFLQIAKNNAIQLTAEIDTSSVQWKEKSIGEALERDNRLIYSLFPAVVAHRFCQTDKILNLNVNDTPIPLQFSQVYASGHAECMSRPITISSGTFSYVVRFRLKTRGGEGDRHLLLVSSGIRRFVTEPQDTRYIKGGINSTILVSLDNPFYRRGEADIRSYASLSFRRDGNEAPYTRWSTGLDQLFFDVLWGKSFQSEDILTDPENYGENQNPHVLIVHNTRLFDPLWLESGISIEEKMRFYEMVRYELQEWSSLDSLSLVSKPVRSQKKQLKVAYPPALLCSHEKDLVLEVWGPQQLFDEVIVALREKKYNGLHIVHEDDSGQFKLNSPSANNLIIKKCDRLDYVDSLEQEQHGNLAYEHRARKIAQNLKRPIESEEITLSLIEILRKDKWDKGKDPKQAVREGFRRAGRLTQFIYSSDSEKKSKRNKSDESNYKHRVFNAILDLLGDAGIVELKTAATLGEERPVLAYDIIQLDRGIYPVLTKLEYGALYVKGRGMDEWRSLQQVVFECEAFDPIPKLNEQGKLEVARWFDEQLRKERLQGREIIVLVAADLRSKGLVGMQNGKINSNYNPPLSPWIELDNGITFIRINSTDEVPAYGFEPMSFSTGVYSDGTSGLYYGVGAKAKTQKGLAKIMTKLYNPSVAFQQPRVVEYMPLGEMEVEERNRLAWMVHSLRELCITFESTSALPYPLKMMATIKKYLKREEREWLNNEAEFLEF
ncbi:DUF3962 domain-containing protein [Paenibacillus sp. N4]|uniref:pPIWI_RE module domain-containing protein n=1 Tax=Paenibacillus vietnamensis TaxID=2590547 RepID=UPI001CD128C3|nr:DUF3962 domain-containing protein [Paenibacillus vietnamensis]MCA0757012.1 DUF3962 domain-containing protein [Paenibacillus vietnamensis]